MVDAAQRVRDLLESEARALLTRLDQVQPLALIETTVLAAAIPRQTQRTIERLLHLGRGRLRGRVRDYLTWLAGPGRSHAPAEQQERFVRLRMEFNDVLSQFDLFNEVATQRSEHRTGVWLAGLDVLASDALRVGVPGYDPAPVVCYLARGPGAAIRRARTRLPGGADNPVGIIRVPRERMISSGVASSLVHEVGHQGAAQLGLVESLRARLYEAYPDPSDPVGQAWRTWISEIVADLWSVGTLGITATVGLLSVVSLPTYFVFRPSGPDPHPTPWLRVLISASMGEAIYPHPQWEGMRRTWAAMYPLDSVPPPRRREIERVAAGIPRLVEVVLGHRAPGLRGLAIGDLWPATERHPERLLARHRAWRGDLGVMARQAPSLVFAVVGQAKAAGVLTPEQESAVLGRLLTAWAVRSSLDPASPVPRPRLPAPSPT